MSTVTELRPTTVVCPTWCGVTRKEHREELADAISGGHLLHRSSPDGLASLVQVLRADGAARPEDERPAIHVYAEELTASEAEHLIRDLQAAVEVVRT